MKNTPLRPSGSTTALALELRLARQCVDDATVRVQRAAHLAHPIVAGALDADVQLLEQIAERLTAVRRELAADALFAAPDPALVRRQHRGRR